MFELSVTGDIGLFCRPIFRLIHWIVPERQDSQDEIALAMLTLSGNGGEPEEVAAAHLPAILEGLAQAKRREFAADAEIEAAFRRVER